MVPKTAQVKITLHIAYVSSVYVKKVFPNRDGNDDDK